MMNRHGADDHVGGLKNLLYVGTLIGPFKRLYLDFVKTARLVIQVVAQVGKHTYLGAEHELHKLVGGRNKFGATGSKHIPGFAAVGNKLRVKSTFDF